MSENNNVSDLKKYLKHSIGQYRLAVRWLKDAGIYKKSYAQDVTFEGKHWKNNGESELAKDSARAYMEAISSVLFWRGKINECNEKLMDLAKKGKK